MRTRLAVLLATLLALTLPARGQLRDLITSPRTLRGSTHIATPRTHVSRTPPRAFGVPDHPSAIETRTISASTPLTDNPSIGEALSVIDTTALNFAFQAPITISEALSVNTGGGLAKPPASATINANDELANGLTFLALYNEGTGATSVTDYVSGAQSATDSNVLWASLPSQTGLTLSGPYVDNVSPTTRANAKFLQSSTVLSDGMFQGNYSGGATWAYCFKPPDGTTTSYVFDNSAQSPPNPTSGAQAEILTYINFPGNGGWIGETLYDANGTNLTTSATPSGKEFQFNTSTLPWIFVVRVLHGGVSGGCDIYCNLDGSGNPIDHLRLAKTIATADCKHSLESSNSHNGTGPIYGINALGIWGTSGLVGSKEGMAYAAVWNRELTVTTDGSSNVTGGEVGDLFSAPCRMMTTTGNSNSVSPTDSASESETLAVNGSATIQSTDPINVSEDLSVNTGVASGTHPRLLIRAQDVPTYQGWAAVANPIYTAIKNQSAINKTKMDTNPSGFGVGDLGQSTGASGPAGSTELAAVLFAFISLVDPDAGERADCASRAHDLVMYICNQAALGYVSTNPQTPFRDPGYVAGSDRGRNMFLGVPLTVDWCYSTFTAPEKSTIRTAMKLWCQKMNIIGTSPNINFPYNDPRLYTSSTRTHAGNNYYQNDGYRNMAFCATCLDPSDDLDGSLFFYLQEVWGRWLYVRNLFINDIGAGSLSPEGQEYATSSMGAAAQTLVALRLAGYDDPTLYGPQTGMLDSAYWANYPTALLSDFSSGQTTINVNIGPDYLPDNVGDIQDYRAYDPIQGVGALGIWARITGNATLLNDCRWIENNIPQGYPNHQAADRAGFWSNGLSSLGIIENFLLFDPGASAPVDPRPGYPTDYVAQGPHYITSRTSWTPGNETWFTAWSPWLYTNHELLSAGQINLFRHNEWLTAPRDGYGLYHGCSDNCNTLSLFTRLTGASGNALINQNRGSQFFVGTTDPTVRYSLTGSYVYVDTDMHGNYQTSNYAGTDITQAWRTTFYLKPSEADTSSFVAVYDRAKSAITGQWKREEWGTRGSAPATVSGNVATSITPKGQRCYFTAVLPAGAVLTAYDPMSTNLLLPSQGFPGETGGADTGAAGFRGKYRLRIEDPGSPTPTTVRMLTVIQGADAGVTTPVTPGTFNSTSGTTFNGVTIATGTAMGTVAILFYQDPSVSFAGTNFTIPAGASKVYVTGLTPNAGYTVVNNAGVVSIAAGGVSAADSGGVLTVNP